MSHSQRAIILNFAVAILMLVAKLAAYLWTGSVAIFSDWAESCMHLFGASITTLCYWYSTRPADEDHPYGHEKIVYFASASEGLFLAFAGFSIVGVALRNFMVGNVVHDLEGGIAILAVLAVINRVVGKYLLSVGRASYNQVLISSGKHLLADVWMTIGVIAGVSLAWFTGLIWVDSAVALLVGLHVFWTSGVVLKASFEGLMEKRDPAVHANIIAHLERATAEALISGYHALTHREINDRLWIEVHLTFPEDLPLHDVHQRACCLEIRIDESFPSRRVWLTTHFEPEEHERHHPEEHFEVQLTARSL